MAPPKALLFDIGGVCVVSPFQAILDYELANHIPPGYINHTITATAPNGAWQLIERGEIPLDEAFFKLFKSELSDPARWDWYWKKILADPKKADLVPQKDRELVKSGKIPTMPEINAKAMFWNMMKMAKSPDPFMYPALKRLKASGKFVMAALSNTTAFPDGVLDENGVPFVNGIPKTEIVAICQKQGLHIPFPESTDAKEDIRENFDAYLSSAHIGLRKPEPKFYQMAIEEVQRLGKAKGLGDIKPDEILFLDDIGMNLKGAKKLGLQTIKVNLGRTKDAVKELQEKVGIQLLGEESKL